MVAGSVFSGVVFPLLVHGLISAAADGGSVGGLAMLTAGSVVAGQMIRQVGSLQIHRAGQRITRDVEIEFEERRVHALIPALDQMESRTPGVLNDAAGRIASTLPKQFTETANRILWSGCQLLLTGATLAVISPIYAALGVSTTLLMGAGLVARHRYLAGRQRELRGVEGELVRFRGSRTPAELEIQLQQGVVESALARFRELLGLRERLVSRLEGTALAHVATAAVVNGTVVPVAVGLLGPAAVATAAIAVVGGMAALGTNVSAEGLRALEAADQLAPALEVSGRLADMRSPESDAEKLEPAGHQVTVDVSRFTYGGAEEGPYLLENSHFEFGGRGARTAVLRGTSGSGKSTVLVLVKYGPESFPGTEARVTVGGVEHINLRPETIFFYRAEIPIPEWKTFRDFLTAGRNDSDAQAVAVLRALFRTEELSAFGFASPQPGEPEKTIHEADVVALGRQIGTPSVGQKQRLRIAQILLASGSPVLLLDEPTANLDVGSTRRVFSAIEQFKGDRTVIIASHDRDLDPSRYDIIDVGAGVVFDHLNQVVGRSQPGLAIEAGPPPRIVHERGILRPELERGEEPPGIDFA